MKKLIVLFASVVLFFALSVPELAVIDTCQDYFSEYTEGRLCFLYDGALDEVLDYFSETEAELTGFGWYEGGGFYFHTDNLNYSVYPRSETTVLITYVPR